MNTSYTFNQPQQSPRMAYLVSQYPSASHSFILREVLGLRQAGWHIDVATLNPDERPADTVTKAERDEQQSTTALKQLGLLNALLSHVKTLVTRPRQYLQTLAFVFGLPTQSLKQSLWKVFYFTEALMLGQWMQSRGLAHLHVHFATAGASVAMLTRKLFPISLSMTVHGPDEFNNVERHWLTQKIEQADFVVCISHFARSQLMYHSATSHWGKLHVCRLGIPSDWLALGRNRLSLPPAFQAEQPFRVLCVGRLTPAKGQSQLVQVVHALRQQGHRIELDLVGHGPDFNALQDQIQTLEAQEHIHLLGLKNLDEVRELLAQADAFVLPSFAEGIPVALMEAMAAGVPVVSTRIAGIAELIEHQRTGLLFHASDCSDLQTQLARLAEHPEQRRELAQAAFEFVAQHYNLSRNVPALSALFRQQLTQESPCKQSALSYAAG